MMNSFGMVNRAEGPLCASAIMACDDFDDDDDAMAMRAKRTLYV